MGRCLFVVRCFCGYLRHELHAIAPAFAAGTGEEVRPGQWPSVVQIDAFGRHMAISSYSY